MGTPSWDRRTPRVPDAVQGLGEAASIPSLFPQQPRLDLGSALGLLSKGHDLGRELSALQTSVGVGHLVGPPAPPGLY